MAKSTNINRISADEVTETERKKPNMNTDGTELKA